MAAKEAKQAAAETGQKVQTVQEVQKAQQEEQKIGAVLLDAVMANYPQHNEARQQLAEFAKVKDDAIAAEQDEAKRQQLFAEGRKAYVEEERKIMQPVFQAVSEAIAKVAKDKNLSAVYNIGAILYGGTDITQEVINELTKEVL